jgi:hypothetical protein
VIPLTKYEGEIGIILELVHYCCISVRDILSTVHCFLFIPKDRRSHHNMKLAWGNLFCLLFHFPLPISDYGKGASKLLPIWLCNKNGCASSPERCNPAQSERVLVWTAKENYREEEKFSRRIRLP